MDLIIPIAGQSSRFPDMRPKWMLNHPNGNLMVAEAIRGLDLDSFDHINFICLKEHYEKYNVEAMFKKQFSKLGLLGKIRLKVIECSSSQPETVYKGLQSLDIQGACLIKDSDNIFSVSRISGNEVCCAYIPETDCGKIDNKSFLVTDELGEIKNIVEKRVISEYFCTGGYAFSSAKDFCRYYEELSDVDNLFVSHIIYKMILDGHAFRARKVTQYSDWGTVEDWFRFCASYATLFIDLDGTLVGNSAEYFSPYWGETEAIKENVKFLSKLYNSGTVQIIITTSRTSSSAEVTEKQLERLGIKYHQIIYDLYHGRRILVNDYAKTNAYPSSVSVNLRRNSEDLSEYLSAYLAL